MRNTIFVIIAVILISACSANNPQISLETDRLDLGEVVNGDIVTRDVRVSNPGNAPLIVEAVSTSCGCTKATLEPMTIPPGGSGTLHIEFDSGAHGPELTGTLERQIFIASNDPDRPEITMVFSAVILLAP